MAKSLKTVLTPGYYEPKSKGDRDFEQQHTVQTREYRAEIKGKRTGSGDEVWNASNVKVAPRPGTTPASGKAGTQTSVSEAHEISTAPIEAIQHDGWHHMDKFAQHARDHLDAKQKARSAKRNADNEPDEQLADHFKKLASHYSKAADHHKDMAAHHAGKFNLSEGTDYSLQSLFELSNELLGRYASKASADAKHKRKLSQRASSAANGRATHDHATGKTTIKKKTNPKLGAAAVKIGAKSSNREYHVSVAKSKMREEFDLSEAAKKKLKLAVKKKYNWKNNKKALRNANS